ncbi:MAG TPA: cytochrome ubiquinol oxidase subunit I [Planctomycetaceae bacterium]|jgi:cytochrome d ubiquinol oxidase subunit I|nr:cytochrome ubiquinol oxidase subunit I [Planctomycetaceae bacterium]
MTGDALLWHRMQFAFTVTYHYLFPQLTMGLALLIVLFKTAALRTGNERYSEVARFWARLFGLNFAMGVVTGIPLEFQFGTNWAQFSKYAGEVIGQTLAMEGIFAFFLESAFLGLFLFGERRLGPRGHLAAAIALFLGSWLSGYFIIVTNAFMQHPVGYVVGEDGILHLGDIWKFVFNPWALWQYAHNMTASVITASFVVSSVGAYWSLMREHVDHARICLRFGVITGLVSCVLIAMPTGDQHGKMVARHQPVTLAAMEGLFKGGPEAELAIIGQPNVKDRRLENPIAVPYVLSFLAYGSFGSTVKGLNDFPQEEWPDNVELLYYAYHIMVGLGTILTLVMAISALLLWRNKLEQARGMLWVLMLSAPFPYIATTAGWWTAELGRQPWLVYQVLRTAQGGSPQVHAGDVVFTTLGFAGLYLALGLLFVLQVVKQIARGPVAAP